MSRWEVTAVGLALIGSLMVSGCLSDAVKKIFGIRDTVGPREIKIQLGEGTKPTFSWNTKSGYTITVSFADRPNGPFLWGIKTPGRDGIHPPVVYGSIPPGAVDISDPLYYRPVLERGERYRVQVNTQFATASGYKVFSP